MSERDNASIAPMPSHSPANTQPSAVGPDAHPAGPEHRPGQPDLAALQAQVAALTAHVASLEQANTELAAIARLARQQADESRVREVLATFQSRDRIGRLESENADILQARDRLQKQSDSQRALNQKAVAALKIQSKYLPPVPIRLPLTHSVYAFRPKRHEPPRLDGRVFSDRARVDGALR